MARRVVIDATPLLYSPFGIGRLTRMMLQSLVSLECEYELMLFGRRLQGSRLRDVGFGLETVHLRLPRASEWLIHQTRLIELLCLGDLYHATDFYLPLHTPEEAVATIHDLIFLTQPETMVDHTRLAAWVPDFARRCRRIITISEYSKSDIVGQLGIDPGLIDVVYPGVDRNLFCPSGDPEGLRRKVAAALGFDRPFFLAVSCSVGRKNTPFLLNAYEALSTHRPSNDLVLVWDPPAAIKERYRDGIDAGRLHFVGHQTDEALADLYRAATALVYPSTYEGFGLPVIEAMSCGTPVISSSASSLPEAGGTVAVYIDPSDERALLTALEAFENGDPAVTGLRAQSLAQAAGFSWDRCARETLDVYRRCFAGE